MQKCTPALSEKDDPVLAYVALGSNLGDRGANIAAAIAKMRATPGIRVGAVSSLMENPAVGGPADSPSFLNAAAEVTTDLPAAVLLRRLHDIERSLGRERRERWEPRPIDLDLLLYGNQVSWESDELMLPHPRMHQRLFVLKPMAEIAPRILHPRLGKSMSALLAELQAPRSAK